MVAQQPLPLVVAPTFLKHRKKTHEYDSLVVSDSLMTACSCVPHYNSIQKHSGTKNGVQRKEHTQLRDNHAKPKLRFDVCNVSSE